MVFTWCKIPNLWGLPLRLGTLWAAELYGLFGVGLVIHGSSILNAFKKFYYIDNSTHEWVFGILPVLIGLLLVLTSITLIYGVYQNIPGLIRLWIIVVTTIHILVVIGLLIVFLYYGSKNVDVTLYNGMVFMYAVMYVESQRFILTGVYSYYKQIQGDTNGRVYSPVNDEMLQLPSVTGFHWALLDSSNGEKFNPGYVPPSVQGHHWVLKRGNNPQTPLIA